jgi:hypothetical protein
MTPLFLMSIISCDSSLCCLLLCFLTEQDLTENVILLFLTNFLCESVSARSSEILVTEYLLDLGFLLVLR